MTSKYYVPKQKVKTNCKRCRKVFVDMPTKKFCSFKCKSQFNEKKIRERDFVAKYRIEIWRIISNKCDICGMEANEINHLKYNIPVRKIYVDRRKKYKVSQEKIDRMLREYCKYLQPLCSKCHNKITIFC